MPSMHYLSPQPSHCFLLQSDQYPEFQTLCAALAAEQPGSLQRNIAVAPKFYEPNHVFPHLELEPKLSPKQLKCNFISQPLKYSDNEWEEKRGCEILCTPIFRKFESVKTEF